MTYYHNDLWSAKRSHLCNQSTDEPQSQCPLKHKETGPIYAIHCSTVRDLRVLNVLIQTSTFQAINPRLSLNKQHDCVIPIGIILVLPWSSYQSSWLYELILLTLNRFKEEGLFISYEPGGCEINERETTACPCTVACAEANALTPFPSSHLPYHRV